MIGKKKQPQALRMAFEGCSCAEIARKLKVTLTPVHDYIKSPAAQEALQSMRLARQTEIAKLGARGAESAVEFLVDLVNDTSASNKERRQAANSLMSRFGYVAGRKLEMTGAEGEPLTFVLDLSGLSDEELEAAEDGLDAVAGGQGDQ